MQQLVRDTAEQCAHAPKPAGSDEDLVGRSDPRDIGERVRRRSSDQLDLILGPVGDVERVAAAPGRVLVLGEQPFVVG